MWRNENYIRRSQPASLSTSVSNCSIIQCKQNFSCCKQHRQTERKTSVKLLFMRYILLPIRKIKYPINIVFERRNKKTTTEEEVNNSKVDSALYVLRQYYGIIHYTLHQPSIRPSIRGRCVLVFDKTLFLYNSINTWIVV